MTPILSQASVAEMAAGKGTKDDWGKPPVQLLPVEALESVADVLAFGARKYDANNWRNGMKLSRCVGAAIRHCFAWLRGEDNDPESGLPHLAHAGCMILFALNLALTRDGSDDRWKRPVVAPATLPEIA